MRARGRSVALAGMASGLLVLAIAAYLSRDRLERSVTRWLSGETWFDPGPALAGQAVALAPGDIAVREFLRFLADHTGRPVVLEAGLAGALENTINIVRAMDHVDADTTVKILEANGFTVGSTAGREGPLRVEAGYHGPSCGDALNVSRPASPFTLTVNAIS